MKRVLYILGLLDDTDIDWLISAGRKRRLGPGEVLMEQGVLSDSLYILIDGSVEVSTAGKVIAELGPGEVLGEISLLDSRPPIGTVTAQTENTILAVSYDALRDKLRADPRFAGRFYRALGVFLAQRIRSTTLMLAIGEVNEEEEELEGELPDEIDPVVLEEISLAGARFRWMMERLQDR